MLCISIVTRRVNVDVALARFSTWNNNPMHQRGMKSIEVFPSLPQRATNAVVSYRQALVDVEALFHVTQTSVLTIENDDFHTCPNRATVNCQIICKAPLVLIYLTLQTRSA